MTQLDGGFSAKTLDSSDPASLTYEPYFGLREKPFSLSPNPRFFFKNPSRAAAFDALIAAIRRREGIIALTGEVGTGKTILCRAVLDSLDKKTFAAYVPDPILSREDLLKILLVDFGVVSLEEIRTGRLRGASRTELSYPLYEFLTSLQPLRAFAVVIIDEAQNVPATLLEEIRILSDVERGDKLLQLLLVGQPELQASLGTPELRQLNQRLTVRVEIGPLTRDDIGSYVSHRLGVAGNSGVIFDPEALHLAYEGSAGVPRVINLLCDGALLRAASTQACTIRAEHIVGAANDLRIRLVAALLAESTDKMPIADAVGRAEQQKQKPMRHGLPQTYQMRHDAHYVDELESRAAAAGGENMTEDRGRSRAAAVDEGIREKDSRRMLAVAAGVALLSFAGLWMYQATPQRSASHISPPAIPSMSPPRVATPDVLPVSLPALSGRDARFAIQMATFQRGVGASESVRELQHLGYGAFQVEVSLRNGERAFAVFLGPYGDRADVDRDYERARQIPGYVAGRIVEVAGGPVP